MSKKDDGTPQGRVAGYETGPDGVRFWRDPGNGQFAKPGWSTAKGLALNLVGLLEDLAKDRGDAGLMVHPKGDALKSLGVGPGDAVRARYLDSTHAMVEIVRDGRLIQRKVAWTSLDRPSDAPDPGLEGTQVAEFAHRLTGPDATEAASDATLPRFGDRVKAIEPWPADAATPEAAIAVANEARAFFDHDLGDGYRSTTLGSSMNRDGKVRVNGVIVDADWREIGSFRRSFTVGDDGTVTVDHEGFGLDSSWQKQGIGSRFVAASIAEYRKAGVDQITTEATSDGQGNGAYTWAKAGFDWDRRRGDHARVLNQVGETMLAADPDSVVGTALAGWSDDKGILPDDFPTPLHVALDPVGAQALKGGGRWHGILNLSDRAREADAKIADVVPDAASSFDPPADDPLAEFVARGEVSYVRVGDIADNWTHEEGPLSRKLAESRVSEFGLPKLYDAIKEAGFVRVPISADSLWNDGATSRDPLTPQDTHVLVNGHHRVAVLNDLDPNAMIPVAWRGGPSANPYLSEDERRRLGAEYSRRERDLAAGIDPDAPAPEPVAVDPAPGPDAPSLPDGGELSPELAAVVALLDGTSTDFDNEDELVMDLGMALFTKDFGDGAYQAEFENGMISLHDESAKFDGIIYDNETFTNLGTFSRALSVDDGTGVVEMYHDVFRLNPDAQGKGIGSMFTAAQLDAYRQAGIDRVRTTAASGTSYDDDGVEYPGMRMNGAYTWAAAGFDWDPEVGYQDANNIGRKILRLDPESKLGAALVAWRGGEPDDTVPIPFDVAADPVGKRVLLGDMGGDQLEPMTWMAVLPLTERGGAAVRQPVTDAGRAKRDGVPLTAPETPAPAVPDVAAPDVAEPLSTVRDRIRQESLFAEDFGFTGTAAPTLFDPDAPPVGRGPLVVGDLDGLGDALDRIEITANGDRFAANLDAEDVATVKRYAAQLFAHRGDYANSTVESVRPTALADGTPAFIVDGLITSESGFPIGSWQRQIAADRSVQPPVWAVRGTDLRMGEDNRGLGYGMWFVAESETALRDAGFDHVITDAVSDPARDLNGAYTMATAGYDWDTSPEGVDLVRTLGDALLGEDEDSWLGEALAGWDGTITEDFPTPLDIALDPDGFELLRHGQASWIGRRSLQDPNRTDLPPLEDPAWLGTRADVSVPELLSESAPFRAFSPGVQAALENVASRWYDHDLGDGYTSEVVGVSLARNSAGGLPVTVMGVIRDGDGNRIGEFTRALHRVNVDDLMEPVADGDDIVINHEYLSIGVDHQGKGLGSRFMAASLDAYQGHGIDVVTTNAMTDPLENLNGAYTWAVAGFDWDPASWSLAQEIGAHMLNADPDSVVGRMLVDDYNPDTSPTPLDVAMDPVGKLVLKGEPGVVSWNGVLPVNPGAARREPVTPAGRDRAGLTPPRPVPVSAADVGEFLAYTFANPDNPPTEAETRDAMALLYEHTLPSGYRTTVTEAKIRPGQFTGINVDGAIYESDGTLVGHFSRTIGESSDGLTARHESISLKEYHQGKGVGAQLTASVFDAYRDAGIAKVKTDAASTGTDAMNGAYTWAVAGFDWDPDDSKTLDKMHDIGNRMLRSDPDSALGQALVDTTGDNLADSPTPLDIALDPTGGNVLKGGAGNLVWPGVYYPSGDQREPITNPARERLGLDLIIPPTPAVPNTDDTADGTVPFDPNEPIPLTPRVGSRLMELGHSGYDNEEANAEATAIAKALFDHDLGDGYSTRIVTASSRSTVEQQGIVAADGEILGPDGTRVGTFSRQFRPMLFGTNGDGADRTPEVVWETPPQVSPIEGMELGETKSFAAADLPATLMPGAVISMTSASGSTLTGSVTDNGQIRFNDSPSLGMAWASTLGEFATEVPGRNRLRDAWSADGTVTITLPDSIPDEKRTVWNVTPDPDVGLGVVNDTLKIDLAHQGKGVGSRFVAASENGYAQIGVDQAIVHAVTRNYPTDPEDARYNGAYTWAKGGGYDFVAKGDFVDGVDMVRTLGRRMIQLDETSQMGALLSEWNGRDRDNIPTPLEVALDPTGAAALKDSEYSQWWGAKPLSDRFKAMQRAQREQSLTAPAEPPAPKITNDDTTVGGDVPFDLDQPIPLTSRVKARLAHLSEHGTDGKASNHPELLAIARAVFNQDDIGGGIRASVTGVYNLNGEGGTLDVNGILVNSSGRQIGFFDRRFRPMSAGDLNAVDVETVMVETPQPQVSPLPGVGLGETTRHSLIDLPENLPEGTVLTWTKTGGPHSPTMQYRAVRRPWGSYDVEATGPTGDVSPMPSMKLEDFRLDAARLSDDSTADLTLPDVIPPVVSAQHTVTPRPNAGYGVQNYSIEIADEFQRQGIGSRFIAASEESYAKVGFDQTVVHAVGDGSRFNGAYTWAKACVPMRARMLTQRGWLSWHEIDAATDLAAQWDNGDLRWLPIVSVDRYGSRETITFGKHGWSFTATGNHRVLASVGVESGQSRSPRSPRLARLDELMPKFGTYSRASILTAAPLVAGDRSGLSPDQAALLGWLITDGSVVIRQRGVSGQHVEVAATITQSKELGRKEISALLERMGGWSGRWMDGPTRSAVNVPTRHVRELHSVVGVPAIVGVGATDRLKAGLSDVVLRMGHEQLAAFVRAAELAEGASGFLGDDAEHPGNRRRMWQNPGACNDALRLAFFLAGNRIGKSVPRRGSTNESWAVSAATIPTQSLAVTGRTTEETWCPHTTTGTWVCELDGIMSITGNSGYDWMHDPSGFGQAMLERDPNSEIGKRLAEFDGGEDWSGVPTPLEVALDPIGKELLLNGNVEWWGTKPLSDEFKAIAAARRQPTPGAPDTPVAPTTAPEDLPINFGRWSVGEMVDADDINLLPEGTDFSAGFDSYTALGGDMFDNDGTTITGERLRRQLDGEQVYIDALPGNSGPPTPEPRFGDTYRDQADAYTPFIQIAYPGGSADDFSTSGLKAHIRSDNPDEVAAVLDRIGDVVGRHDLGVKAGTNRFFTLTENDATQNGKGVTIYFPRHLDEHAAVMDLAAALDGYTPSVDGPPGSDKPLAGGEIPSFIGFRREFQHDSDVTDFGYYRQLYTNATEDEAAVSINDLGGSPDTATPEPVGGERRLPGWYLARMGNDITVEGANGTRATGQISTVSQDTRRGDTVTISTADGPRSFPVNTTIVVGSTGVEPWADGGMVARYRNRDYRIDSDGNVTKVDDYNAAIAKSTATGVKNAAIADATERFTDAAPGPAPAPTPAPDPVPDVPNMPEPAPEVPEPVAPGTPEVPTLPTGGRDFAVARPEHVLNVGYSDGAIIEQLKQLPKGAGRQYTVTDAAGNRFRMVGKDERGLRYQMLAANDDTVVGEWIMLPAEAPFTISDVVPGTYDETFAGSDAAITRLGDEMLAKNPDLAPIVWSDISPAAWLDMSTEEQAQNGMPDAEQGQALRSAITRFLGEAQRAVVRVGDTSLSEREYLPYRFYKVESATVPTREYGAETTGAAKVLWTTEPPTPDAPAFKLTRAQLDSALDSDEPGRPDFVWTGQVRAPEWDAPVPDNPRTEEQRSAAVQKLATNIFPVDIPIWEADRLEEALPMGPKGMLIDALTRGGYATPTDPAFQSLRVPVNGVVIRQDGSVQWSLSAPGEGDLSAPRLYDGDVTYSIDDPLLPQAVAAATQRNQATQLSQILNGRQQRSGRGRALGTPAGDYARWVDTQSKQILDESFTDTTDLAYDQETGAFTRSATPTEYHVNSEQLRRAFADRDEQGNPRLWLNADDRAGVVGIETDYSKVRDKSLPFDDRVAALAEQRTALQRLLPGDGPQTWFSGLATSATITDVIDGTADEQTQRNMQRVAMLQEFGMELHALVSEQFAASKVAAHSVDQADTDKAMAALSTGVFERELRSDVARGEHPVLGRLVAQMDGDPDMADDPFVLEDVKADSDDPTDGYTMTMRRLASGNSVQVKVGRAAIGGPLVTWIAKENQGARAEQIGPVTLHTDGHMADLAQFGDTLRSLNHVTKEADALAEVTAANRGGRRVVKANPFPPEATRDAMAAMLENTPVDRFAFYKFTHDASSGEYQIDGDAAHLSAVTAGTKDGRKNVKLTFVTMLGSYYERKFTVTINDDNSMTLNKNGSRRAVGRAPANVDSNTYASMAAVVADLKKQAPKADKKDDKPTVDAATVAESTPLKAFHAVMEKMGVDMSTDESLQIGRGGEGPLKPIGEATAGLAETARAGLAVFPRAWTTVLAKNRPIRLQLRRGNVDFRSEGGYNAQPGTRVNPSGPHDLISTPDITLRPDYADVAGHEFGHSFQHVIPGLEKAEQWYLVSRVAASPPEKQKPRVYGTGRRGRTDYVFEDEFARSYTGRTYGSGVSEAREVFTTAVQGMYNDIGGQSGFGADTRLQAWAIAMMALHDPGVGTNTDRAAMTGAQLLGASYSKKDVESLLKSSELTVAQRNELKDILASM